jgi:hypothetical protein
MRHTLIDIDEEVRRTHLRKQEKLGTTVKQYESPEAVVHLMMDALLAMTAPPYYEEYNEGRTDRTSVTFSRIPSIDFALVNQAVRSHLASIPDEFTLIAFGMINRELPGSEDALEIEINEITEVYVKVQRFGLKPIASTI